MEGETKGEEKKEEKKEEGEKEREEEIEMIKKFCKEKKEEYGRTPILLLNPFRDIDWLRNKIYIQIDVSLEVANKNAIVYDSTTDSLYEFINGFWRKIERKVMSF
ncbi:MAG: hypothetical protein QXI58_03860 [Candidatus Micrarchaeia archaeon]